MSKNKGKDGEMQVAKLLCDISTKEEKCDFTRPTNTNTADGGADLVLEHPEGFTEHLSSIADGESKSIFRANDEQNKTEKTRIDVKATPSKISADTVDKFGGDIRKNPDCKGHMLVGGSGMTKGATEKFNSIREAVNNDGKKVTYISNEGLEEAENHYQALPNPDENKEI